MRKRSKAREFCLQILYQIDITKQPVNEAIINFWRVQEDPVEDDVQKFVNEIVPGVVEHKPSLDEHISLHAENWKLDRMAVVDRNILRLGSFELMHRQDIPPKVTINECVELAKKFSGVESSKFVNAILDKIKIEHNR